VHTSDHVNPT